MTATNPCIDTSQEIQAESDLASALHGHCWVCGVSRPDGLQLRFRTERSGTVWTDFDCPERFAGYDGVLHGGMVATLLDAAMMHCLFAAKKAAMIADLHVRFRAPVRTGAAATLRAWQIRTRGAMEEVCAELWQEGELRASARGKFLRSQAGDNPKVYRLSMRRPAAGEADQAEPNH